MKYFFKVDVDFFEQDKVDILRKDHEDASDIIISLLALWAHCRKHSKDGVLNGSIRRIETKAKWKGETGRLIEVLTNEDTHFIDYEDGVYRMHNWYLHNQDLNTKREEAISSSATQSIHSRWAKKERDILKENGIDDISECPWLGVWKEGPQSGRLKVRYKKVPSFMELGKDTFWKRSHFKETNSSRNKAGDYKLLDLIKKNSKKCKCGELFVSTVSNICGKCRGIR